MPVIGASRSRLHQDIVLGFGKQLAVPIANPSRIIVLMLNAVTDSSLAFTSTSTVSPVPNAVGLASGLLRPS